MSNLIFCLCFLTHQASLGWRGFLVDSWRTLVAGFLLTYVTPRSFLVPPPPCHLPKSWAPSGEHQQLRVCFACSNAGKGKKHLPRVSSLCGHCLILNSIHISPETSEKKIVWERFLCIHPLQISIHAYPCPSASSRQWFNDFAKVPFEKLSWGSLMNPTESEFFPFSLFLCKTLIKEW